jgi:flagellum-specific peptidoglycan hydrolase FlgJ
MNNLSFQVMFYTLRLAHPKLLNVSARLPLAQAHVESGNWLKPIFTAYNNMFGMKQPSVRQTTSLGPTPTGFASFRSAWDSIRDYLLWLEAFELYSDEALEKRLVANYAVGDKQYLNKLNAVAAGFAGELVSPMALAVKTAAGAALAFAAVKAVKKRL